MRRAPPIPITQPELYVESSDGGDMKRAAVKEAKGVWEVNGTLVPGPAVFPLLVKGDSVHGVGVVHTPRGPLRYATAPSAALPTAPRTTKWRTICSLKPGGRSFSVDLGTYVDERGWHHCPAVRKAINVTPSGIDRRVNADPASSAPVMSPPDVMWELQQLRFKHRNVLAVLGAETEWPKNAEEPTLTVYTEWCSGGNLVVDRNHPRQRFGWSGLLHILEGAFEGMRIINEDWTRYHGDIKPDNVFVRLRPHGQLPVGVIGDIDDLVNLKMCQAGDLGHTVLSTVCYGAPIEHCDALRDQCALTLVAAETLADRDFWGDCADNFYVAYDHKQGRPILDDPGLSKFGFYGQIPYLEDEGWLPGIYDRFWTAVKDNPADLAHIPLAIRSRMEVLARERPNNTHDRIAAYDQLLKDWGTYSRAHKAITTGLYRTRQDGRAK